VNFSRHDSTCSDHRIVPDGNTLQYDCTCTNPNIVTYPHRVTQKRLFSNTSNPFGPVVMVRDIAEWTYKAVASDFDALRCVKHSEPVYVRTTVNDQSRGIFSRTSRQQHDVII
jgi:hypothetical protein